MNCSAVWPVVLVLASTWGRADPAAGADLNLEIAEHTGAYVLELDAPSSGARTKCLDVTLSNFARSSERKLWLVVRSVDRSDAGVRPVYETVTLVDVPANRSGRVPICLPRPNARARGVASQSAIRQVAVYGVSARDQAAGHWPGPQDDALRLSNWLHLPDSLLANRLPVAEHLSRSRPLP